MPCPHTQQPKGNQANSLRTARPCVNQIHTRQAWQPGDLYHFLALIRRQRAALTKLA